MHTKTILVALIALSVALPIAAAQTTVTANAGPDKTVNAGESASFDGTASTGSIVSYNWDFGDGTTGSGSTVTKTYTSSGTYTVTLLVIGSTGATATDTASVIVRSSDTTAPNVTHSAPTSGLVSGGSINVTANVTDNIGIAGLTLYYKASTESTFNSTSMSCSGTATNKSCFGYIPSSVTTASTVNYYLRATDTRSPTANVATYPSNAPTGTMNLSLSDTTPPTITHTPAESATSGQSLNVTATVTDNVAVSSVSLSYQLGVNGTFGSTTSVSMAQVGSSTTWYGVINLSSSSATDVSYYITAGDGSNNATSPAAAPSSKHEVGVVSGNAPSITHTAVRNGTAGQALTLTATVSAGSGQTLSTVMIRYRAVGATTFENVTMTGASGSTSSDTFTGTIPADNVTDAGVEYHIRANDTAGNVVRSPSAGTTSPNRVYTPPANVTGVAATQSGSSVVVTWSALTSTVTSSVASYKVYRSANDVSYSLLATVTGASSASYTDTTPTIGLTAYYKVSAVDSYSAEGNQSASASVQVLPGTPSDLAATPSAPGNLSVTFSTVASAGWYIVSATQGVTTVTANTTSGVATVGNLTDGVAASVTVRAFASTNLGGAASSAVSATPYGYAATPTGLAATRGASGVSLSWTNASTAANPVVNYTVQRSTSSSTGFAAIATGVTATTYSDTSAAAGTTYYYRVLASNALGSGTPSASVEAAASSGGSGGGSGGSSGGSSSGGASSGGTTTNASSTNATTNATANATGNATTTPSGNATQGSTTNATTPGATNATTPTPTPPTAATPTPATPSAPTPATPSPATPSTPTPSPTPVAQPTAAPSPTPEGSGVRVPGFEAVALLGAAGAALYVLRRRS